MLLKEKLLKLQPNIVPGDLEGTHSVSEFYQTKTMEHILAIASSAFCSLTWKGIPSN